MRYHRLSLAPRHGILRSLTRAELAALEETEVNGEHDLFRRCCIAVLNSGLQADDPQALFDSYRDFDIRIRSTSRGVRLDLLNVPDNEHVFVDGQLNNGSQEHLFAVLRDIVFFRSEMARTRAHDLETASGITDAVFAIFRNAHMIDLDRPPRMAVCWGGHAIDRDEYEYSKTVGYQLGLRGLDICTGCGAGAMKGPMKGAALGHLKQRTDDSLFMGLTEPGIIASEPPNPVVNTLIIFPNIEMRLEAFVRRGHGVIIFPGGVGTAEEILYLLGILLHPDNADLPFPLILTGNADSAAYFEAIEDLIRAVMGPRARARYQVIIDDPVRVAREMKAGMEHVEQWRRDQGEHLHFNRRLVVDPMFQTPFVPDHAGVRALNLDLGQPTHLLAANMRRMFSALVAGNVKADGIARIREHGPYEIQAPAELMTRLDRLLTRFVAQKRMRIGDGADYQPCYRLIDAA